MSALLFGSISTVADTSEIQRAAFNEAFREHGLDWKWERDDYRAMLTGNGGADRITEYARQLGQDVDVTAVHDTKSKLFQEMLTRVPIGTRPGVVDTIRAARENGWKVAWVTTTASANIDAILDSLDPDLTPADFDMVIDAASAAAPKPDPAAYTLALRRLNEAPDDCVAIEDNIGGLDAARSAGVPCVVFANQNTTGHDFGAAPRVNRLVFDELTALVAQN
jgi:HAD superfamily hydrolase (TIGR01509 family)